MDPGSSCSSTGVDVDYDERKPDDVRFETAVHLSALCMFDS